MASPSIGKRLRAGIVTALMLSSAITFGVLYMVGRAERVHTFERSLEDDLRTIASITQVYPNNELYVNVDPKLLTDYLAGGHRFFQVWDAAVLYLLDTSPSLEAMKFRFEHPSGITESSRRFDARLPDGRRVSMIWRRASAQWAASPEVLQSAGMNIRDRDVDVLVGRSRDELDDSLFPLALACMAGAILLPLIAAGLLRVLVPRALKPLSDLTQAIELRQPDDTVAFLSTSTREVELIVQRLNRLIVRISEVRARERSFLVDTAHELRTPLAELLVEADVALLSPEDAPRLQRALRQIKDVAHRMARLVDALFRVARHSRKLEVPTVEVCLRDVLMAAVDAAAMASEQRKLSWLIDVPETVKVPADPLLLRVLLDNLVGNVVVHARAGSPVRVAWTEVACSGCLDIQNQCDTHGSAVRSDERMGHGLTIASLYSQAMALNLLTHRQGLLFEVTITFRLKPLPG